MLNNIPTTECFKTFWSEMVNAVMQIQACFSFFFFVYFTQTSSDGNVNEKKNITSSAPDDIFQETPTQVVENSRAKRFHI